MEHGIRGLATQGLATIRQLAVAKPLITKHSFQAFSTLLATAGLSLGTTMTTLGQSVFTGTNASQNLGASAGFSLLGGGLLQVSLTNTYGGDTADQAHVLTGLFFSGINVLTPVSATVAAGSVTWAGSTSSNALSSSLLGTEWAYGTGTPTGSKLTGATAGIVSAGFYTPGNGNFTNSLPGDMLDGSAYGLVSAGYAGSDGDGLGNNPYVGDAVIFVLSGFTGSLSTITNVSFQYGTGLSEPTLINVSMVPEPVTAAFVGFGLAGLFAFRRRLGR
jgi:hypothetical protein